MSIPGVVHIWCQHKISIFIFSQLCAVTAEQGSLCHKRGSDKVLRRQTRKFSDHQPQTSASISVFARYFCSYPPPPPCRVIYLIFSRYEKVWKWPPCHLCVKDHRNGFCKMWTASFRAFYTLAWNACLYNPVCEIFMFKNCRLHVDRYRYCFN